MCETDIANAMCASLCISPTLIPYFAFNNISLIRFNYGIVIFLELELYLDCICILKYSGISTPKGAWNGLWDTDPLLMFWFELYCLIMIWIMSMSFVTLVGSSADKDYFPSMRFCGESDLPTSRPSRKDYPPSLNCKVTSGSLNTCLFFLKKGLGASSAFSEMGLTNTSW